jgi:N-methylhydantoinase B/oxoprolinase/acetone carboxylase alpha subunit
VIRADGRKEELRSKDNRQLNAGDRVRIETPSGGGFGK